MDDMKFFLDTLASPFTWLMHLPQWQGFLLIGFILTYTLAMAGFVLARLGIKPLWSLLLLVPYLNVIGLWVLPRVMRKTSVDPSLKN